jgi:tetratricopeptide (TPR) repeat protein
MAPRPAPDAEGYEGDPDKDAGATATDNCESPQNADLNAGALPSQPAARTDERARAPSDRTELDDEGEAPIDSVHESVPDSSGILETPRDSMTERLTDDRIARNIAAVTLLTSGDRLAQEGRIEAALTEYQRVVELEATSPHSDTKLYLAIALRERTIGLLALSRIEESGRELNALRELAKWYGDRNVGEEAAHAMIATAAHLAQDGSDGSRDAAILLWGDAAALLEDTVTSARRTVRFQSLGDRAMLLVERGRYAEAADANRSLLEELDDPIEMPLLLTRAIAELSLARALEGMMLLENARQAYVTLARKYAQTSIIEVSDLVAQALWRCANSYLLDRRPHLAYAYYSAITDRYGASRSASVKATLGAAQLGAGMLRDGVDRGDEGPLIVAMFEHARWLDENGHESTAEIERAHIGVLQARLVREARSVEVDAAAAAGEVRPIYAEWSSMVP